LKDSFEVSQVSKPDFSDEVKEPEKKKRGPKKGSKRGPRTTLSAGDKQAVSLAGQSLATASVAVLSAVQAGVRKRELIVNREQEQALISAWESVAEKYFYLFGKFGPEISLAGVIIMIWTSNGESPIIEQIENDNAEKK